MAAELLCRAVEIPQVIPEAHCRELPAVETQVSTRQEDVKAFPAQSVGTRGLMHAKPDVFLRIAPGKQH
jgi:hypothetical protein